MRMYGHGRGMCTRAYELNAPCGCMAVWRCAYGDCYAIPCKGSLCEKCIREPMQIVYHGAYRLVCVNVPIISFGGGTENPYLCSAMRFWVHGTSCMYNYKLFEL